MRYFIRKSVLSLREENRDLFAKVNGTTDLLIIQSSMVKSLPITVGGDEYVEVELTVKPDSSNRSMKGVF